MRKTLLAVLLLFMPAMQVFAEESQCYSPTELQAEQLLRLHSELMVITVTCAQSSTGDNLVPMYTGFTRANLPALHAAEQTMMHYYKLNFDGAPVDHLDRLRTRLGNEFGQKIADISAPEFCRQFRDKVVAFYGATPAQIYQESLRMEQTEKSEHPLCKNSATHVATDN